jgi:glycosyltransferase involved in cell wall biosynthesis
MPEMPKLPPIASQPLSVVLLARPDDSNFEAALGAWTTFLAGLGREHEILLADDATTDRTAEWVEQHPGIRLVRDPKRPGIGAALRAALPEARHPLLFYAPCCQSYQPADLPRLIAEIDNVHLVSGHRVGRRVPFWLRSIEWMYRWFMRIVFGLPLEWSPGWLGWRGHVRNGLGRILFGVRLHDAECAFRLFRREIFRRIFIQSDGFFVHLEILAKANFLQAMMSEVPVQFGFRADDWEETNKERCRRRKEGWRVFAHPEFGPTVLPEAEPPRSISIGALPDQPASENVQTEN